MATFFYATSVDVTNGSNLVIVNDGDDVQGIREGSWLQVGDNPLVEVKRTFLSTGGTPTIELAVDWPYNSDTGRRALAAPTAADLAELVEKVRQLIARSQDITDNVIGSFEELFTSEDSTVEIEVGGDTIEVVPWGFVKKTIEEEWDDYKEEFDVTLARVAVEEKVKRDATLYLDFAKNEGSERAGLGINRSSALGLIDYTCPDPATGETPIGTIETVGVDEPRLVSREGVSQGLLVEPASTNLLTPSNGLDQWGGTNNVGVSLSSEKSVFADDDRAWEIEVTDESNPTITRGISPSSSGVFSVHFDVKYVNQPWVYLRLQGTDDFRAYFNIQNFTKGIEQGAIVSSKIERLANGWARINITGMITTTGTRSVRLQIPGSDGGTSDASVGDKILVAHAQAEQGFPTSYIPTEGSAVTRGAGQNVRANSNRLISKSQLLFYVEWYHLKPHNPELVSSIAKLQKTLEAQWRGIGFEYTNSSFTSLRLAVRNLDDGYTQNRTGVDALEGLNKAVIYIDANNQEIKFCINGDLETQSISESDLSALINLLNELKVIHAGSGTRLGGGVGNEGGPSGQPLSKCVVCSSSFTDGEIIALTTLEDE